MKRFFIGKYFYNFTVYIFIILLLLAAPFSVGLYSNVSNKASENKKGYNEEITRLHTELKRIEKSLADSSLAIINSKDTIKVLQKRLNEEQINSDSTRRGYENAIRLETDRVNRLELAQHNMIVEKDHKIDSILKLLNDTTNAMTTQKNNIASENNYLKSQMTNKDNMIDILNDSVRKLSRILPLESSSIRAMESVIGDYDCKPSAGSIASTAKKVRYFDCGIKFLHPLKNSLIFNYKIIHNTRKGEMIILNESYTIEANISECYHYLELKEKISSGEYWVRISYSGVSVESPSITID